jgi:HK97 family phage major capsid protein
VHAGTAAGESAGPPKFSLICQFVVARRGAPPRAGGNTRPLTKEKEMDIETDTGLETKAGIPPDAVVTHAEMMRAFEEFKEANDKQLAGIEQRRNNKPKGFLSYNSVPNASWSWGNTGYIASGLAGAFPSSSPSDVLVDLIYSVNAGYRQNGVFVMNRKTQSTIRKFKDSTGNYLWQPPAIPGAKATLMTFPVIEAEDMPDIAANSLSIAFGDFNRGYLIVDRSGVTVLRDPYTAKPYVLFYTTKRVGGGVQDFSAIKFLKFSAS